MVCERREASACLIMLSAKQGNHWYHFYNVFGMTRPGRYRSYTHPDLPHTKRTLYHLSYRGGIISSIFLEKYDKWEGRWRRECCLQFMFLWLVSRDRIDLSEPVLWYYSYYKRPFLFEPPHDKTNKMTVRPAKTQISLGIRPV